MTGPAFGRAKLQCLLPCTPQILTGGRGHRGPALDRVSRPAVPEPRTLGLRCDMGPSGARWRLVQIEGADRDAGEPRSQRSRRQCGTEEADSGWAPCGSTSTGGSKY